MIASFGYAQAAGTASGTSKTSTTSSKSKKNTSSASKTSKSVKLDINTASKEELSQLPGIGDALSQKIIDGRPYNAKNDLVRRKIIPQSTYDGIKDQIIAHRAAGASKTSKKGSSGAAQ
jgi:DNA uptake protein ComE-like DNA-binding protein